MKVKTKEYEVPKVDVLRMCTQEILCESSLSGGSNESVVDDGTKFSSWDWTY